MIESMRRWCDIRVERPKEWPGSHFNGGGLPVISMAKTATEIDCVIPLPNATAPINAYPCM